MLPYWQRLCHSVSRSNRGVHQRNATVTDYGTKEPGKPMVPTLMSVPRSNCRVITGGYMCAHDQEVDFIRALDHLAACEEIYSRIGIAGEYAMRMKIAPLRTRVNAGERSRELYDAIFQIEL